MANGEIMKILDNKSASEDAQAMAFPTFLASLTEAEKLEFVARAQIHPHISHLFEALSEENKTKALTIAKALLAEQNAENSRITH